MNRLSIVLLIAVACTLGACESSNGSAGPQTREADVLPSGLSRVESDQVCIANDRFMGKP